MQLYGGQTHNMYKIFIKLLYFSLTFIKILFKSKENLIFENMALRQQLIAYLSKREKPKITDIDRSFWIALKEIWPKWIHNLLIVKPETLIKWQKQQFKDYWRKKSLKNRKPGRLPIDKEIINLIKQMATENNWGAPRIYSELLMLGYDNVKQRTVSRYLRKFRSNYPDLKSVNHG